MLSSTIFAKAEPLSVGVEAPAITATDQDGNKINLAEIYAKGLTLVYFYPKADTPGCTAEACSLRDSFENLTTRGLQIIGVSRDGAAAQKAFQSKYQLPFTLISDTNGALAKAFGVPSLMGIYSSRASFLVSDGRIVWRTLKAQTRGSAQEIRKAIDSLDSACPPQPFIEESHTH
ncbi:MAG: peroxiredoxin [Verrucomicrobia bacterium]|nr:MAG: peroxiredoxin [Verrucomicrobiota bacterium]